MIRLEIPILFLEDYAGSSTIGCRKCNDLEAKRFTYKTNWYISTIAGDFRSNVHGLFIAIDGVSGFTDGHNNFSVAESVGNGACIVVPNNFSAKSFAQSTEWNIGAIVCYIRSRIFLGDHFVVNNEIGRTDRHYNGGINRNILFAEGVSQSVSINGFRSRILNCYYDISSGFLVRVNSHIDSAVFNLVISKAYIDLCVFVALAFYISICIPSCINCFTIFIYDRYFNGVVLSNRTSFLIESESVGAHAVNNSQFFGSLYLCIFIKCKKGNFATIVFFVTFSIYSERTIIFAKAYISLATFKINSSAIYKTKFYVRTFCRSLNTISINCVNSTSYFTITYDSFCIIVHINFKSYSVTNLNSVKAQFNDCVARSLIFDTKTNGVFTSLQSIATRIGQCIFVGVRNCYYRKFIIISSLIKTFWSTYENCINGRVSCNIAISIFENHFSYTSKVWICHIYILRISIHYFDRSSNIIAIYSYIKDFFSIIARKNDRICTWNSAIHYLYIKLSFTIVYSHSLFNRSFSTSFVNIDAFTFIAILNRNYLTIEIFCRSCSASNYTIYG